MSTNGLIPAHAGKTRAAPQPAGQLRAHPRSRGENRVKGVAAVQLRGSSPLTRGKRYLCELLAGVPRLIPAHAGKTPRAPGAGVNSRAHPRSRGENRAASSRTSPASGSSRRPRLPAHPRSRGETLQSLEQAPTPSGSSPLTRGKQLKRPGGRVRPRLIPAHAGKTLSDLRFYQADRSDLGKP